MAVLVRSLVERAYYCNSSGYCYYSSWYSWQRWVVLGVILVIALILILSCACLSARRRRTRGLAPYYGTAWAAPPPAYDVHNIGGQSGPQYGGQTYAAQTQGGPPQYTPAGSNAEYYNVAPQQQGPGQYEMGGYRGENSPYNPPVMSPPPAHVSKV
ncbi:hypothetical protein Dda_3794 [Drechslerella dactyloides]|uniref:Uncharacterized protein n=1 Tax=Drechslerella dactyloides TaxID=74499 RepID=A0AAD6NJV2_DREDA|nr:hypothetical protein Dda_3794 [Drechslerella dactyloides]